MSMRVYGYLRESMGVYVSLDKYAWWMGIGGMGGMGGMGGYVCL